VFFFQRQGVISASIAPITASHKARFLKPVNFAKKQGAKLRPRLAIDRFVAHTKYTSATNTMD
jgi:hypothetical protein